jgi:crotonobetainyl-CoA:carnitine CoA-transferase CaiB-like acyl-CoA transferase
VVEHAVRADKAGDGDMDGSEAWPLAGLRVLELASEIAGPYCGKMLVDAGAEVIKLEHPDGGDPLRRYTASGQALAEGEDGALFQYLNASKRSLVLDLESPSDRLQLLDLAATADLVIASFEPGRLSQLGLDLDALQARNPALSLVSISPWGASGPFSRHPSTEFTLQAATGSIAYRGLRDRKPVAAGGHIGEWIAGTFAAAGALSAWLSARDSGTGQRVDVSTFEAMLLSLTHYHDLNSQWFEGPLPRAVEIPSIEPARDGWVGFCTITGQQWTDFCAMLGRQDIAEDHRYLDAKMRMEHLEVMQEMIHSWTRERTVEEIIEVATLLRIPVAPVGNGKILPEIDHLVERGVFVESPGGFLQPRIPHLLTKSQLRPFSPAPGLGQHTQEILGERAEPGLADAGHAPPSPRENPTLPLAGLRVVDLTAFWAGPVAAAYLADMGADVVKVESIQRPDGMRFAGSVPGERLWEWSPIFAGANSGKRDVTLRLDDREGHALLERLIAGADVVIENYSARVLEGFGLGWERVRALNPRAIMVRMPAFGLDGPWRDRTGFAMTIEQVSGLAWITGYPDMPLVVRGACDPVGGIHAVFALLVALEHRRRTGGERGEGQLVEVPLLETALNIAAEQIIEYSAYGELLSRDENRSPRAAPQGLYRCADEGEYVAVSIADDAQWEALRQLMGDPAWARDPELSRAEGRRRRHDTLDEQLEIWLGTQSQSQAVERLLAAGIPAAAAINVHDLMPNAQLEHREFFQTMEHPVTGETRYPGLPMVFSAFGTRLHKSPPPTLGQHNQEILCGELGLSREEFEQLREAQVIGERPSFM